VNGVVAIVPILQALLRSLAADPPRHVCGVCGCLLKIDETCPVCRSNLA
jgi:rubrerythrin